MVDLNKLRNALWQDIAAKNDGKTMGGPLEEKELPGGMLMLYRTCSITNKVYSIEVSDHDYRAYRKSEPLAKMFGHLSDDHREFIMTGTTPSEWDYFMGGGEEDE